MSGQRALGYLLRVDSDAMDTDCPVSVYPGYVLQNNVQHLVDMSPQHRINWSGFDHDDGYVIEMDDDEERVLSIPFVHTWVDTRWPCGLEVIAYGKTDSSGTFHVKARVVPDVPGLSPFDNGVTPYFEDSGSTTSPTSVELINGIYYPGTTPEPFGGWRVFSTLENGLAANAIVAMSRLELRVWVTSGSGSSNSGITRLSVREFC